MLEALLPIINKVTTLIRGNSANFLDISDVHTTPYFSRQASLLPYNQFLEQRLPLFLKVGKTNCFPLSISV